MFARTCALLLLLFHVPSFSQTSGTPPAFEVADVKPNKSGQIRMAVDFQPGGRLSAVNVPLKVLIALAYKVRPDAVTGGPAWLEAERFDIVAKALQTSTPDELRLMLRTLLAEQFKLDTHSDQKMMPAFALLPGKNTSKLQPSDATLLTDQRCRTVDANAGQKHVVCDHMTTALFAETLQELAPRDIDVPVVDQTGIGGTYTFNLAWSPLTRSGDLRPLDLSSGPPLSEAIEDQLGLKLERKRLPLPVIVIDRVEKP